MSTTGRILDWIWNGPAWKPLDPTPRRRPPTLWWLSLAASLGLGALGLGGRIDREIADVSLVAFYLSYATVLATALWLWWRRPATRTGQFLVPWLLALLVADLVYPYPDSRVVTTVALGLGTAGFVSIDLAFAVYPTGRPFSAWAWRIVIFDTILYSTWNVSLLLFADARGCLVCTPREPSYLYLGHPWEALPTLGQVGSGLSLFSATAFALLLVRRWATSSEGVRRSLLPFTACGVLFLSMAFPYFIDVASGGPGFAAEHEWYIVYLGKPLWAASIVFGVWSTRRSRRVVADLVVDLAGVPAGGVRDALARATGDPTLQLALWRPDTQSWVDHTGHPTALPTDGTRAVTLIGDRLAALVHDPGLADEQGLLEAIGSAGHLALENERLHAELQAQLGELRDSNARILTAADTERRKLERQLRDGAHRTLDQIDASLDRLARHVATPDGHDLLRGTRDELDSALAELRELARGIHPSTLTDHGLAAAVGAVAARMPIPVDTDISPDPLPPHVETAAYYVAAEALTNISRYANATHATIDGTIDADAVTIRITDDGAGGADPSRGTGLAGLRDRLTALGGNLHIASPLGEGTTLTATIPLTGPLTP